MKDFTLEKIGGTIPPNAQLDFNVYGDKVFALKVPDGCKIAFDNKAFVLLRTGIRYGVNGWFSQTLREILMKINSNIANALTPNTFNKISIRNDNNTSVDVEILAGFGDINDDSVIITNTVSTSENWGIDVFSNGFTVDGIKGFVNYFGSRLAVVENTGNVPLFLSNKGDVSSYGFSIQPMEKISFPFYNNFYLTTGNASINGSYAVVIFKQV